MSFEHKMKSYEDWCEANGGDDWDWDDAYEIALSECGQMPDGFCTMAGTEHCDWDCPFRDLE